MAAEALSAKLGLAPRIIKMARKPETTRLLAL
jgi:hypothetical protein